VIITIASGKGGTGKTTVALSLARVMPGPVQLLDCDVEAPNDHLFLHPTVTARHDVTIPVPKIDAQRCVRCGECSSLCVFNALVTLPHQTIVFPELCHGCGGCSRVCPSGAIAEVPRTVGVVEEGHADGIRIVQGRLAVGEALVPPVIDAVRQRARSGGVVLIDAPPGTSCSMFAATRGADAAVLVTEPTPFGLNDLELAVEALEVLGIPSVVVLNRAGIGDNRVHAFCADRNITILAEIPDDRRIAEATAKGKVVADALPEMRLEFEALAKKLLDPKTFGARADIRRPA